MPADVAERIILDVLSGDGGVQPRGGASVVVGESGVGRTRLLRRLAAAAPEGVPVVMVAARPGREVPSWAVWELGYRLGEVAAGRGAPLEVRDAAAPDAAALYEQLPTGRSLLLVDDVHCCDEFSARVLAELADMVLRDSADGAADRRPTLVFSVAAGHLPGTAVDPPGPLAALLARLPRYELPPLDPTGLARLVTGWLGMPVGRRLADDLYEASGGNARAVCGLLLDARDNGALRSLPDGVECDPGHRLGFPATHPWPDRVTELPYQAGELARFLAVAGPCRVDALPAVLGPVCPEPDKAVAVLAAAGLIATDDTGVVRLSRPALRDALCARMPAWRRAAAQAGALAARSGAGAARDAELWRLALRSTRSGRPLASAVVAPLLERDAGQPLTADERGALLAELLDLTDRHAEAEQFARTAEVLEFWARTGRWARIAGLHRRLIGET
ncbi:MAG: hypothetical protein QOF98_2214, partial [Streptomyces sp.]|nr:hypothetical protein [Streptomyces sp.]